jgi:hypothetical protein
VAFQRHEAAFHENLPTKGKIKTTENGHKVFNRCNYNGTLMKGKKEMMKFFLI